jgi:protein gp37
MGEQTEIRWCDHTFNPIWGCTRVSEACQHCYAEALAKRYGHDVWGKGGARRTFGEKHWNEPVRWNRKAEEAGEPALVFCASMADVFEDHPVWEEERPRLWDLIAHTPWLTWQLLTKRPENVSSMVPDAWYAPGAWPVNVWVGTTVETQRWADVRLPLLIKVPAPVLFVSAEPLFSHLNLTDHLAYEGSPGVNWVIAGGESGGKARPSHPNWFRNLRDTCVALGVPFLFKQWGEWCASYQVPGGAVAPGKTAMVDPEGGIHDLDEVRGLYPSGWAGVNRCGKKAAGWMLDGRTWDQIPERRVACAL